MIQAKSGGKKGMDIEQAACRGAEVVSPEHAACSTLDIGSR